MSRHQRAQRAKRRKRRQSGPRMATAKQRRFIRDLMQERGDGDPPPGYLRGLTLAQASALITRLRGPAEPERYSHCLACGQELTDEESITRGFGPTCAKRYA